jgi:hypothetical protein
MLLFQVEDTGTYRRGHRNSPLLPGGSRQCRPAGPHRQPTAARHLLDAWLRCGGGHGNAGYEGNFPALLLPELAGRPRRRCLSASRTGMIAAASSGPVLPARAADAAELTSGTQSAGSQHSPARPGPWRPLPSPSGPLQPGHPNFPRGVARCGQASPGVRRAAQERLGDLLHVCQPDTGVLLDGKRVTCRSTRSVAGYPPPASAAIACVPVGLAQRAMQLDRESRIEHAVGGKQQATRAAAVTRVQQ